MKILVLCPRFPYPLEKGDKLRMYHMLKHLSKTHELHLIALTDEDIHPTYQHKIDDIVASLTCFKITKFMKFGSILKSLFTKLPFQVSIYYHRSIQKKIQSIVDDLKPDHVFVQLARMAEYARDINCSKSIDYMDSFGVGMERRSAIVNWPISALYLWESKKMKAYEKQIYKWFDNHFIISHQDADSMFLDQNQQLVVLPNGINTKYFSPISSSKIYDIGFVGNMGYPPNVDAAEYLIQKLKPRLNPSLKFLIAGARPDKRVNLLTQNNVEVTGWIEDVRLAYAQCKLFVAPLWSGTGQQNKILEAMAMGIPCVTTPSVNNAIHAKHREEIMVANDEKEFGQCIEELLTDADLYDKIKRNALNFAIQNYSWSHSVDIINDTINKQNIL